MILVSRSTDKYECNPVISYFYLFVFWFMLNPGTTIELPGGSPPSSSIASTVSLSSSGWIDVGQAEREHQENYCYLPTYGKVGR